MIRNSRASDDKLLDIYTRWHRGEESPSIGRSHGISAGYIRTIVARIDRDYAKSEQ
jgi:hypothetical protein